MNELEKQIDELYCLYNDIKNEIRRKDKLFYERWKSGGFIIDEDIMSMYPCLSNFIEEEFDRQGNIIYDDDNDDDDISDKTYDKCYRKEMEGILDD